MRILCNVFCLITSFVVTASNYTPFVREGVKWKYSYRIIYSSNDSITEKNLWFTIKGDSIVGDYTYKKCLYWFDDEEPTVASLLREDVEKKIVYNQYYGEEIVLYDFNDLKNCHYLAYHDIADDDIDTSQVYCNGAELNKYVINRYDYTFIESIGFLSATRAATILYFPYMPQTDDGETRIYEFLALTDMRDNVLYDATNSGVNNITNNPEVEIIANGNLIIVKSAETIVGVKVVAFNGQLVASTSPQNEICEIPITFHNGLYIIEVQTPSGRTSKMVSINRQ